MTKIISRRRTKIAPARESEIQASILDALWKMGHVAWRINTQGVPIHGPGGTILGFRPGPQRGISDIIGLRRGDARFIAIEVKRPGGVVSEEQQAFLDEVSRRGGIALVAYSIDDVLNHQDLNRKKT